MAELYTKKVMELFKHPHNMGRLAKPDGVGKVGNPVCVAPETFVHFNPELAPVSSALPSHFVLSHDGTYNKVMHVSERYHSGELINIRNRLGSVSVTPEHLFLAIKVPKKQKYMRIVNKKKLAENASWHHACDLVVGDLLLYPRLTEMKDVEKISLNIVKARYDFKSKELPDGITVDDDFLRLVGYYLAEGHARLRKCRTFIEFTFNSREKEYVEDVCRIVKKVFGLSAKKKINSERNTANVFVYSANLARFFNGLFGGKADKKHLPGFMLLLPPEKQSQIILGLWRGDGYMRYLGSWPRAGYSTISHQLVHQLKLLLLRQRIMPSIYEEAESIKKGVRRRKAYRIHVGDRESLRKLARMLAVPLEFVDKEQHKSWFDEDFLYTPITRTTKEGYSGKVYNLEVEGAHSFVTGPAALHNCGDVMYLYIKVKDGRIKDVKFETYGCAAAIATSSMITDLAKGKTLKEALEISRGNVSSELGGLPPIKEHCSNLAADALHAAIKDYLSRHPEVKI